MQVAADAQQDAAGAYGRQIVIPNTVIAVQQVTNAVCFRKQFAAIKSVDIDLRRAGLIAADKVAWKTNARYRQAQTTGYKQVNNTKVDGVAGPAVKRFK